MINDSERICKRKNIKIWQQISCSILYFTKWKESNHWPMTQKWQITKKVGIYLTTLLLQVILILSHSTVGIAIQKCPSFQIPFKVWRQ